MFFLLCRQKKRTKEKLPTYLKLLSFSSEKESNKEKLPALQLTVKTAGYHVAPVALLRVQKDAKQVHWVQSKK